jgi:hypothetical protein
MHGSDSLEFNQYSLCNYNNSNIFSTGDEGGGGVPKILHEIVLAGLISCKLPPNCKPQTMNFKILLKAVMFVYLKEHTVK